LRGHALIAAGRGCAMGE